MFHKKQRMQDKVKKRLKRKLLETSSKCFWCDCELTSSTATLDHVYSQWDIRRYFKCGGRQPVVLSCSACNSKREKFDRVLAYKTYPELKKFIVGGGKLWQFFEPLVKIELLLMRISDLRNTIKNIKRRLKE